MPRATLLEKSITAVRVFRNWLWVVPDRLGMVRTIDYATRLGPVMRCRGGETDSGTVAVVFSGLEYPDNLLRLGELPKDSVVWDLGANIGAFAIWAHHVAAGKIGRMLCVEPDTENLELLKGNLNRNGVENAVIENGVVGPEDGVAWLDCARAKDAICVCEDETGRSTNQYRLETLAARHSFDRVNLLKMDIEGAEFATLEASTDFVRNRVDSMVVETHGHGTGLNNSLVGLFRDNFDITAITECVLFFSNRQRG